MAKEIRTLVGEFKRVADIIKSDKLKFRIENVTGKGKNIKVILKDNLKTDLSLFVPTWGNMYEILSKESEHTTPFTKNIGDDCLKAPSDRDQFRIVNSYSHENYYSYDGDLLDGNSGGSGWNSADIELYYSPYYLKDQISPHEHFLIDGKIVMGAFLSGTPGENDINLAARGLKEWMKEYVIGRSYAPIMLEIKDLRSRQKKKKNGREARYHENEKLGNLIKIINREI